MAFSNPYLEAMREAWLNARITQGFGPVDYAAEPSYTLPNGVRIPHFHYGLDLVLPRTESGGAPPILSPVSGRVIAAGPSGNGFGNYVRVLAPNGYTYTFAHLHDWTAQFFTRNIAPRPLRVGDTIRAGDIIGHQGGAPGDPNPGNSSGAHLHLQINAPNGQPIDPGQTNDALFYTLYHSLGFGGGYLPTQEDVIPDPTRLTFNPVPFPIPTNPGLADRRYYPNLGRWATNLFNGEGTNDPGGTVTTGGPGGAQGDYQYTGAGNYTGSSSGFFAGAGSLFSFLGQPGGLLNSANQPTATLTDSTTGGTTIDPGKVMIFLMTAGAGFIFLIIGLRRLGEEKPVAAVTQPIIQPVIAVKEKTVQAGKLAAGAAAL